MARTIQSLFQWDTRYAHHALCMDCDILSATDNMYWDTEDLTYHCSQKLNSIATQSIKIQVILEMFKYKITLFNN